MIKMFTEKKGVVYNPYIGFTSFQHFRGEALYSDCITGRSTGVAGCETENYECYPIPDGVEEKGREQGYYPDTTVAYIRVLWKEFEPKQGEYNYAFIEDILKKAREKGQTVMFRLMPHSTCARDDVPDWLKKLMPCPERPDGMRVKDSPTDPEYLRLFGKAIEKIGERFDKDKTLDCVDVSLGGAWGEGSQSFDKKEMQKLMDIYVKVFPNTKLIGQFLNVELLNHIGATRPIGWRADGAGSPKHMNEIYPAAFPLIKKDSWKTAPVSFESYWWISEWYRQGWDIDAIIKMTLDNHISTFNTKSFPIQYEWKDKIEKWLMKMGYRFVLREIEYPENVKQGESFSLKLKIDNVGVAPIYNKLPVKFRLKGPESVEFCSDVDITKWLPGKINETVEISVPNNISKGGYDLEICIGGGDLPNVSFADDLPCSDGYFTLANVEIV